MTASKNIVISLVMTIFLFSSCASYYQKSYQFQQQFSSGNIKEAQAFLINQKKAAEKKDRLLYFLDRGVVEQKLGNYEASNVYFEKAYLYNQDFRKNFKYDIIGSLANPMLKPYKAEDHEVVLLHFYKAINFIQLNDFDAALVEVRRVNISLNDLNDKYEDKKNRYKEDAFAHLLMGIIYEAKNDFNNAFIAYRNSLNVYQGVYSEAFQVEVPDQLKKDLLRTAALNGFRTELQQYESEFGMKYEKENSTEGELVFFWLNGLSPVKGEFSMNLVRSEGTGGNLVFANESGSYTFPINLTGQVNSSNQEGIEDVRFVRMAIPKYKARKPLISEAYLMVDGKRMDMELAEDVEQIAFAGLEDRMLREIGKSIARLVLKQAAEIVASNQNKDAGFVLSALNAITEKADTRNWQSLPHSIYYSRVSLAEGSHAIDLVTNGRSISQQTIDVQIEMDKPETIFRTFHSLESTPPIEQ